MYEVPYLDDSLFGRPTGEAERMPYYVSSLKIGGSYCQVDRLVIYSEDDTEIVEVYTNGQESVPAIDMAAIRYKGCVHKTRMPD